MRACELSTPAFADGKSTPLRRAGPASRMENQHRFGGLARLRGWKINTASAGWPAFADGKSTPLRRAGPASRMENQHRFGGLARLRRRKMKTALGRGGIPAGRCLHGSAEERNGRAPRADPPV